MEATISERVVLPELFPLPGLRERHNDVGNARPDVGAHDHWNGLPYWGPWTKCMTVKNRQVTMLAPMIKGMASRTGAIGQICMTAKKNQVPMLSP
jgi:hypothetical protein